METLALRPDVEGYSKKYAPATVIAIKTAGGFPRRRLDLLNATAFYTVSFTVAKDKFDYFHEFYRAYLENPQWFNFMMVDSFTNPTDKYTNYHAQILPKSYKLNAVIGHRWEFSIDIEAFKADPA